jgi:hypothetical protein
MASSGPPSAITRSAALRSSALQQRDAHDVAVAAHRLVADALVPQQRPEVRLVAIQRLADRGLHVDFVHEVHAAAQVEPEAHRLEADGAQQKAGVRGASVSAAT